MNFKKAIGKTIKSIDFIDSSHKVTTYDDSPLPEVTRESVVNAVRIYFTDGTDDEISLRCD